jgi:hypothetical protein
MKVVEPRFCEVCKTQIPKSRKTTIKDYQKKRFCCRDCFITYRKQNPNSHFDRKQYMKDYVKQYRQREDVKEKRKLEAKQNYQKQKIKISELKHFEKSKQDELNEPKNFIKYIRKDLDIKRYREASKENEQSKRTHFSIILDTCDYGLLLILSKQSNIQIYELTEIIGLAQINLFNHLCKLIRLNLISVSKILKGEGLAKRWIKVYSLTERGKNLLGVLGEQMKNFILNDNEKRKEIEYRQKCREKLLEVVENE